MTTRTTVYFDPPVYQALKIKAATSGRKISEILNTLIRQNLLEDLEDLQDIKTRKKEKSVSYEDFLTQLKADGTL